METKIYDYQLHDIIFSTSVVLANLFYIDGCLYQQSDNELLDRDDYKYIGFGQDNITVDDAKGKCAITGVFLWGDCSIEFRIAPLGNLEDGDFACWSEFNTEILERVKEHLIGML